MCSGVSNVMYIKAVLISDQRFDPYNKGEQMVFPPPHHLVESKAGCLTGNLWK